LAEPSFSSFGSSHRLILRLELFIDRTPHPVQVRGLSRDRFGEDNFRGSARQLVSSSALGNLVESAPLFVHGEKDAVITIEMGALSLFRSSFMAVLLHVETGLRQAGV
jgi:hypothetical protein